MYVLAVGTLKRLHNTFIKANPSSSSLNLHFCALMNSKWTWVGGGLQSEFRALWSSHALDAEHILMLSKRGWRKQTVPQLDSRLGQTMLEISLLTSLWEKSRQQRWCLHVSPVVNSVFMFISVTALRMMTMSLRLLEGNNTQPRQPTIWPLNLTDRKFDWQFFIRILVFVPRNKHLIIVIIADHLVSY